MPRTFAPSSNVTVPVGVPEVAGVTVAVNATALPKADGFSAETRDVDVAVSKPNAWIRSVPTKTTPWATATVLYLPPTFNSLGLLCQSSLIVIPSTAYKTG